MGAGSDGGQVWFPPSTFPGTFSCWKQVLLHGPLGQVGELVSALGRRTRLAGEELRAVAAAAAEGRRGCRAGRGVTRLAEVARYALLLCQSSVKVLCLQQAMGAYPQGVGLTECWGSERAGRGSAAGRGAARLPDAGSSGQPERYAVRSSIAIAELLPALSRGLQVCAELFGRDEGRGGGSESLDAWADAGVDAATLTEVLDCTVTCSAPTLFCASLAMAKHAEAVGGVEQQQQQQQQQQEDTAADAAGRDRCGSDNSGGGSGHGSRAAFSGGITVGGDGTTTGSGVVGGDCPWRQLLLRDVRLMELLGAVLELHARVKAAAAAARLPGSRGLQQKLVHQRHVLARAVCQAACTFPAEFCAGVDGEGGDAAQTAAAARGSGAGSSGHGRGCTPCMPLTAVEAVLETDDQRTLEARVLEGEAPLASTGMAWDAAQTCMEQYGIPRDNVPEALRALLPPAEARAAVAAAATASAAVAAAATGV